MRHGRNCSSTSPAWKLLRPSFVSVTYGAGGTTRERTHDLIVRIHRETNLTAVSHLTCVCHTEEELSAILDRYATSGIVNILALGGDPPRNQIGYDRSKDAFAHADGLVRFIKSRTLPGDPRGFGLGVAGFPEGHPATPNRLTEMDYLKQKVDAGADYICTQLFFDNRDFYDFRERCDLAEIKVPIIAGVMPVASRSGMVRMARVGAGSAVPGRSVTRDRPLRRRRGGCQGRRPLGDGAVPRFARPRRSRHPLLYAQPFRRDATDL